MLGLRELGRELPANGKRLIVYVEIDRCAADAIRSVTGCRLGKRTPTLLDDRVLASLEAAGAVGLSPFRVSVVAMRGVNEDELAKLARLTLARPWHVRFIELMPTGAGLPGHRVFEERFLSVARARAALGPLEALAPASGGPAQIYRLPGAREKVGLVAPVSEHFCGACNRLRLKARGELRSCLFSEEGISLRPALERGDRASIGSGARGRRRRAGDGQDRRVAR